MRRCKSVRRSRAREEGARAIQIEGRLQHIQQQLARKPALQDDQRKVAADLALLEGQLKGKEAESDARSSARVEGLRADKLSLEGLVRDAERVKERLEQQRKQAEAHQERILRYQGVIASRADIESGMERLASLRAQHDAMNEARIEYDSLKVRESELSKCIAQEHSRLAEQAKGLERQIKNELEPALQAVPLSERKLQEANDQLDKALTGLQAMEAKSEALVSLTGHVGRLESEMNAVKAEGKQLRDKQLMFNSSDSSALCPLCRTPLSQDQCSDVSQSYQTEIDEKMRLFWSVQAQLKNVEAERAATEQVLAGRAALQEQRDQAQRAVATQNAELAKAEKAAEQLDALREQASGLQRRLEAHEYAPEEQADLVEVQAKLGALGYNADAHRSLYDQIQAIQEVEKRAQSLREAEEGLPQEKQALMTVQRLCAEDEEEIEQLRRKAEGIASAVRELPALEEELVRHNAALEGLQRSYRSLLQQQGDVEGDLRRLAELESGMPAERNALLAAQEAQGLYEELQSAFGRQGVQAMLIDTLLPKVEDTANELLARMTDGRMHVKLETQRERRGGQGGTIETLDITISDELGARAYELFSGGEAFRINLALRIALSKELARRRGAPLPTLFIDEGFGTQDASGRDRILDVMGTIQGDFEKIFVITHLEDLKDAFPVHIQVEKDERGASVWIA